MRSLIRVVCLLSCILFASTVQAESKPNILVMLADDLGYSDLSCYGSTENETPHLDALANQGLRLTDFYAACAVCSPSRAASLTGRFPVRVGVYSWIHPSQKIHLRVEEKTTAELLKAAGYRTAHVGKWHLGDDLVDGSGPKPTPADHGFDHWFATANNASPSHHNPKNFVRNGTAVGETEGYSCQLVVDEAIGWLEESESEQPFYLNVCFHEPHAPVSAPPGYRKRHLNTKKPDYYGCIENMDAAVGRLLGYLRETGLDNNTFVLFTSDNGSYMAGSNDPLKGRKTQLWEGGIREPGIIRWPGHTTPGTISQEPAGIVDILPTLCEVAGISPPNDRTLDGVSLVPLFKAKELKRNHPLYWFYNPSRPVCVIREGDYCLVADPTLDLPRPNMFNEKFIGPIKETELTNFRLYNLRTDEKQEHDLSAEEPERFQLMVASMRKLHREVVSEGYDWRDH